MRRQTRQQPAAQSTGQAKGDVTTRSIEQLSNQTTSDAQPESKFASRAAPNSSRAKKSTGRRPLSASETHAVNARDRGRCTFVDANGAQCTNDRWIQRHHKIPVSLGGGNDPANLASLCPFHHDMVHQLGFPIEGQVNWLREPSRAYLR